MNNSQAINSNNKGIRIISSPSLTLSLSHFLVSAQGPRELCLIKRAVCVSVVREVNSAAAGCLPWPGPSVITLLISTEVQETGLGTPHPWPHCGCTLRPWGGHLIP